MARRQWTFVIFSDSRSGVRQIRLTRAIAQAGIAVALLLLGACSGDADEPVASDVTVTTEAGSGDGFDEQDVADAAAVAGVAVTLALGRRDGRSLDAWLLSAIQQSRSPKQHAAVAAKPIAATMTRTASSSGYELGLLAAAGSLTLIPGAVVIYFVRNYIARGFALGRV